MQGMGDSPDISNGIVPSDFFGGDFSDRVRREEKDLSELILRTLSEMKAPQEMAQFISNNVKSPGQIARIKRLVLEKLNTLGADKENKIKEAFDVAVQDVTNRFSPESLSLKEGDLPEIPYDYRAAIRAYLINGDASLFLRLLEPMEASKNIESLMKLLNSVKTYDLEVDRVPNARKDLKHSTYELRTLCMQASNGKIDSRTVYTRSINPKYFDNPDSPIGLEYAAEPMNYIPERVKVQARTVQNSIADGVAMSNRLKKIIKGKKTFFCFGGNCGVGKTSSAKADPIFRQVLVNGEFIGTFGPDILKTSLRKGVNKVTALQVHIEGVSITRKLASELERSGVECAMVFDEMFRNPARLEEMIDICEKKGGVIDFRDIDGPLIASALRVLVRDIKTEPCMPFRVIASGLQTLRTNRKNLVELVKRTEAIEKYQMLVVDDDYNPVLAAEKVDGKFHIYDQALYNKATQSPQQVELDAVKATVIDEAFLRNLKKHPIPGVNVDAVSRHQGKTIGQALDDRSCELPYWD